MARFILLICLVLSTGLVFSTVYAQNESYSDADASKGDGEVEEPQPNITGIWEGYYSYSDGRSSERFVWEIQDSDGSLTGISRESGTLGDARLSGQRRGDRVDIIKSYDGSGRGDHSVEYSGKLEGSTISGTWRIGTYAGYFSITKA